MRLITHTIKRIASPLLRCERSTARDVTCPFGSPAEYIDCSELMDSGLNG